MGALWNVPPFQVSSHHQESVPSFSTRFHISEERLSNGY